MRRFALSTALVLLAAPALAQQTPSDADVSRFIEAVRAIGCTVETDAQAEQVERATGFDDAKLGEIVGVLLESGQAVIPPSMEGLRLVTEGCR